MKYQITGYQVIYRNGNRDNIKPFASYRDGQYRNRPQTDNEGEGSGTCKSFLYRN